MDSNPQPLPDMSAQDRILFDLFSSIPAFTMNASDSRARQLLDELPRLQESDLTSETRDGSCPVCYVPFLAILAEEESASVMDSPAHPIEELGVTKLSKSWQCGHVFCRKDITKWILEGNNSCPMCRKGLLDPTVQPDPEPPRGNLFGASPHLEEFYRQALGIDIVPSNESDDPSHPPPRSDAFNMFS